MDNDLLSLKSKFTQQSFQMSTRIVGFIKTHSDTAGQAVTFSMLPGDM